MADKNPITFVSIDIEADGKAPGISSMLSLGACAVTVTNDGVVDVGEPAFSRTFSVNMYPLEGATADAETMAWWAKPEQRQAWAAAQVNRVDPALGIAAFHRWMDQLPGRKVMVAYPAGFDFTWVYWYSVRFGHPITFSAFDMKTAAAVLLRLPFPFAAKRNFPPRWKSDLPHTHRAVDDAREQADLFVRMLTDMNRVQLQELADVR